MVDNMRINDLTRELKSAKVKLIVKAEKRGIYEDFGSFESRAIRDKFDIGYGAYPEEKEMLSMVQEFENWAMNYDG